MKNVIEKLGTNGCLTLGTVIGLWGNKYELMEFITGEDLQYLHSLNDTTLDKADSEYVSNLFSKLFQTYHKCKAELPTVIEHYQIKLAETSVWLTLPKSFFDDFEALKNLDHVTDYVTRYNEMYTLLKLLESFVMCSVIESVSKKVDAVKSDTKVVHVKFGGNRGKNDQPLPPTAA